LSKEPRAKTKEPGQKNKELIALSIEYRANDQGKIPINFLNLINTLSHHHIIISPHYHIITLSDYHTITLPHHHIITLPHYLITTSSHYHITT